MHFKNLVLSIVFILSLIKKNLTDIVSYIRNNYSDDHLKLYRKLQNETLKLEKTKLDIKFLRRCKTYDILPKFL